MRLKILILIYPFPFPIIRRISTSETCRNIGLNWTLIAGGCITREVYHIPDEYKETYNLEANHCNGFLIQSRISVYNKDDIFNMSPTVGTLSTDNTFLINGNSNYDYMPDMFNFNFNGLSGSFVVGNDGEIKMVSDAMVNVDYQAYKDFNLKYVNTWIFPVMKCQK